MAKYFHFFFIISFFSISFVFIALEPLHPCEPYDPIEQKKDDVSSKNPDFASFLAKLQKAIKTKDVKFIDTILEPSIYFSADEHGYGKKNFLQFWALDKSPKDSEFWKTLNDTIVLGFSQNDSGLFTAPFFFGNLPESVDPYSQSLLIGNVVNVRSGNTIKSPIIAQLSWEYMRTTYDEGVAFNEKKEGEPCPWQKVCISDGRPGYVCSTYLRSPFGYRAGFKKIKGKWMMVFFTTGAD